MTYWTARVEKPDGAGGWVQVATVGTAAEVGTSARYVSGDTAGEVAQTILRHYWPINLSDWLEASKDDPQRWANARRARAGIADHRIVIAVNTELNYPRATEPPVEYAILVGEIRQQAIRTHVAELAAARLAVQELREKLKRAQSDVQHCAYQIGEAVSEAENAGVPEADIAKARRAPRKPRTTRPEARR